MLPAGQLPADSARRRDIPGAYWVSFFLVWRCHRLLRCCHLAWGLRSVRPVPYSCLLHQLHPLLVKLPVSHTTAAFQAVSRTTATSQACHREACCLELLVWPSSWHGMHNKFSTACRSGQFASSPRQTALLQLAAGYSLWTNRSFKTPLLAAAVVCIFGNVLYAVGYDVKTLWILLASRLLVGFGELTRLAVIHMVQAHGICLACQRHVAGVTVVALTFLTDNVQGTLGLKASVWCLFCLLCEFIVQLMNSVIISCIVYSSSVGRCCGALQAQQGQ